MINYSRSGAVAALAFAAVLGGCSSSNNRAARATATATNAPAAAAPSTTRAAGAPTPRPAQPIGTLAPTDPALTALVQKLTPLLLQTADLPQTFKTFQPAGVFPVSNADYARGQATAADIQSRLDMDGRLGGAQTSWTLTGQYRSGQKTVTSIVDNVSEFQNADGTKDGLALIFSQIAPSGTTPQGDQYNTRQLDIGSFGDESHAYRVETRPNVSVAGTPAATIEQVSLVTYVAALRRGKAVAIINIAAINLDPSADELKQLMTIQDQRLKSAGY